MNIRRSSGFSLLEVLIAFAIIMVSIVSLVSLHRFYIRSEADSAMLNGAMQLAESKLDDLRMFDSVATSSGVTAYNDIANDTGGTIIPDANHQLTVGSYTYTLRWTVSNSDLTGFTVPSSTTIYPSKNITISVSWSNSSNENKSISLSGIVSKIVSVDSEQIANSSEASGVTPKVTYTPGVAPDVISIDLGNGSKQETTKPLPTVSNSGGSVSVTFDTVTYDSTTNTQVLSSFNSLSCQCKLSAQNAETLLPGIPIQLNEGLLYWSLGGTKSKKTAISANNQQSSLCGVCCANHFDGSTTEGVSFSDYYNQLDQAPSKYTFNGSTYSVVTTPNSTFIDSCRLILLDGVYKPLPDWNLIKLTVMSSSFLSDTDNVSKYQEYISYVVKAYVSMMKDDLTWSTSSSNRQALDLNSIISFPTWLSTHYPSTSTNVTANVGSSPRQLIARGIFVDILDKNTSWLSSLDVNDINFLANIPFYDINMTLLSRWTSADTSKATVANDLIKTLDTTDADYYGVYRRGYITPLATGSTVITASAYQGNSSVAAYQYNKNSLEIPVSSFGNTYASSGSLNLTISSSGSSSNTTIYGKVYCYDKPNNKVTDCVQGQSNKLTSISISGTGATCELETVKNETTYLLYSCTVTPNVSASVSVTSVPTGFTASPSSVSLFYDSSNPNTSGGCFNVYNSVIESSALPTTCP